MKVGDVLRFLILKDRRTLLFFAFSAVLHGTVSASFVIEQEGLPAIAFTPAEVWNEDQPSRRLDALRERRAKSPLYVST